jgi:predicted MPP superfamily phosphohydrolase
MADPQLIAALATADAASLLVGAWLALRVPVRGAWREAAWLVPAAVVVGVVFVEVGSRWHGFAVLRAACHALFCVLLPLLAVRAWTWRRRWPRAAVAALSAAVGGEACYVWALHVEPFRLEVTTEWVYSRRLTGLAAPVRVVAIADLQPDEIGAHEVAVFDRVVALRPDLVVFLGDTFSVHGEQFSLQQPLLHAQLARLQPRLGMFAVDGDVDADAAHRVFEGTAVRVLVDEHEALPDVPIDVIGLSRARSRRLSMDAGLVRRLGGDRFVLGHAPDYMHVAFEHRLRIDGLLLAGHTHGGQVQVPGFGPLITLSSVPRWLAAGGVFRAGDAWLGVSRGIGMERDDAPRIRFWCRPQLLVLDLAPAP